MKFFDLIVRLLGFDETINVKVQFFKRLPIEISAKVFEYLSMKEKTELEHYDKTLKNIISYQLKPEVENFQSVLGYKLDCSKKDYYDPRIYKEFEYLFKAVSFSTNLYALENDQSTLRALALMANILYKDLHIPLITLAQFKNLNLDAENVKNNKNISIIKKILKNPSRYQNSFKYLTTRLMCSRTNLTAMMVYELNMEWEDVKKLSRYNFRVKFKHILHTFLIFSLTIVPITVLILTSWFTLTGSFPVHCRFVVMLVVNPFFLHWAARFENFADL